MQAITKINELLIKESTKDASPISGHVLQLIIGGLAFFLPIILIVGAAILNDCQLVQNSISAYYHTIMRDFFVGTLCAVSVCMFAYYGYHRYDNILANLAGIFALGVAFFPTSVGKPVTDCIGLEIDSGVYTYFHYISAALLFLILAIFCLVLFRIKGDNPPKRKVYRNRIYSTCGIIILCSIILMFIYSFVPDEKLKGLHLIRPVFILEAISLAAFSISWLVKGGIILKDPKVT